MSIFKEGNTARITIQGIRGMINIDSLGGFWFEANRATEMAAQHGAREFSRDDEGRALTMVFDAHRIAEFSEALKASNLLFHRKPRIVPLNLSEQVMHTRDLVV